METYMFTQDSPGVSILVERSDVEQEATLICSGVVAAHCVGPFHTFQESVHHLDLSFHTAYSPDR